VAGNTAGVALARPEPEPAKCLDCGVPLKDHDFVNGQGYVCKIKPCVKCSTYHGTERPCPSSPVLQGQEQPKASEPPATVTREGGAVGTGPGLNPPLAEPPETKPPISREYRLRLTPYTNQILPKEGKMMPSEGIGGVPMKLTKFAAIFSGVKDIDQMNVEQWESLVNFIEEFYKTNGAIALDEYINRA